ncbi:polysaccharide deacetylase family protein [Paraburkholderia sp. PREW-6R]|uniref:polysaccharide deacetylase family protein n=1 Tax=Paraburkholderia sp. PREW-6R TaxID=3141544 RepID=UPI0031F4A214
MIGILFPRSAQQAAKLVLAAVRRSVTHGQASAIARADDSAPSIRVAVDLPDAWGDELVAWLRAGARKLVVFGRVPAALADSLGWRYAEFPAELEAASRSEPAPSREFRASRAAVEYGEAAAVLGARAWARPFERFDFADEWNNLGYGAIRADGSCWSIAQGRDAGVAELAALTIDGARHSSYAALADVGASSVLWFNRAVGPCDSYEWRVVENFLSGYRADSLPCQPVLSEIPYGYDAAITSRLDCDEDVESARDLYMLYRHLNIPFTLAVHTVNLADERNHPILRELLEHGGAVLSHTASHAPNWGGSYEAALHEGTHSANLLHGVTGRRVRYAVSPFHQSPDYALRALADGGYIGCVGGIIRNDPEFVLARGGELAGMPHGFIGHSQQCMLHGECMLAEGDALAVFKQAFDQAFQTGTLFGYLDHPFSPRYAYGWPDEPTRVAAHRAFLDYLSTRASKPLFLHEEAALDFLLQRSRVQVRETGGAFSVTLPDRYGADGLQVGIEYKRRLLPCVTEAALS